MNSEYSPKKFILWENIKFYAILCEISRMAFLFVISKNSVIVFIIVYKHMKFLNFLIHILIFLYTHMFNFCIQPMGTIVLFFLNISLLGVIIK